MCQTLTGGDCLDKVYMGLDVGYPEAHWHTTSDGETFVGGKVHIDQFAQLTTELAVNVLGCEYTGRLAEPWIVSAAEKGMESYFYHTAERKAVNRISKQRQKTDERDSRGIARTLRIWHTLELRRAVGFYDDMFINANVVWNAWTLRGLLASAEQLRRLEVASGNRILTAKRVLRDEVAKQWEGIRKLANPEPSWEAVREWRDKHFAQEYDLLTKIDGVGEVTASHLIAALCPVERFPDRQHVEAYVGFLPVVAQSGKANKKHKQARSGNPTLRGKLYMAVMQNITKDGGKMTVLGQYYQRRLNALSAADLKRRGARVPIMLATGRKLLRIAYTIMLRHEEPHNPYARPAPPPKPLMPQHLMSQADYGREAGISRQLVCHRVKTGKLSTEEWEGKNYIVREQTGGQP